MKVIVKFTAAVAALALLISGPVSMALGQEVLKDKNSSFLNPLSALDTAVFKSFVERPLFSSTRSVPEDSVSTDDTVPAITSSTLNIRLLGVIVTPQGASARILDVDDGTSHSLREGETFNDWAVVTIDKAVLRLRKDDETIDFPLFAKATREMITKEPASPDAEVEPAQSAVRQTPRLVRLVKPRPGIDEAQTARDSPSRHAQDLIDFFGPDAGKAK